MSELIALNMTLFLDEKFNMTIWNGFNPAYPSQCYNSKGASYSLECLYNQICPQFSHYFVEMGIIILISYIALSWSCWWYFKHGYKRFPVLNCPFFGDISKVETRIYWDTLIRSKIAKVMAGYIALAVWLSIYQ
jgi:hypothetical protein